MNTWGFEGKKHLGFWEILQLLGDSSTWGPPPLLSQKGTLPPKAPKKRLKPMHTIYEKCSPSRGCGRLVALEAMLRVRFEEWHSERS